MTYEWQIEPGDNVKVFISASAEDAFGGVVRYLPQASGDAWIIEANDGTIIYVQSYSKIVRLKAAA